MDRVISLDDPASLDGDVAGLKAAHLAEARARGLSVLPGFVATAAAGVPWIRAGRAALDGPGLGAARAAVGAVGFDPVLRAELEQVRGLGDRLVARPSTRLDDDGAWAGAFATYQDIAPSEISTAVRGCWASIFSPDAVARLRHMSCDPLDVGMAVLIQPQLDPAAGGWARVTGHGIEVAMVDGPPGPLLAGVRQGRRAMVGPDGSIAERTEPPTGSNHIISMVAQAARRIADEMDADQLEWASVADELWILQIGRTPPDATGVLASVRPGSGLLAFRRVAALLVGRRGPLGERLVAPWAGAADPCAAVMSDAPTADALAEAERLAARLTSEVADASGLEVDRLVAGLMAGDAEIARRLETIRLDPDPVGRLLGALDRVATRLVAAGRLERPSDLWAQTLDWVRAAVAGDPIVPARTRVPADEWSELIQGTIASVGRPTKGHGAAPGWAFGRVAWAERPEVAPDVLPGDVLIIPSPLIAFAPLLWDVSAVVAMSGSPGAHLCSVARSLRVPAVVSAAVGPRPLDDAIGAVDGVSGDVWLWAP